MWNEMQNIFENNFKLFLHQRAMAKSRGKNFAVKLFNTHTNPTQAHSQSEQESVERAEDTKWKYE